MIPKEYCFVLATIKLTMIHKSIARHRLVDWHHAINIDKAQFFGTVLAAPFHSALDTSLRCVRDHVRLADMAKLRALPTIHVVKVLVRRALIAQRVVWHLLHAPQAGLDPLLVCHLRNAVGNARWDTFAQRVQHPEQTPLVQLVDIAPYLDSLLLSDVHHVLSVPMVSVQH